jgi:hypothetical protein
VKLPDVNGVKYSLKVKNIEMTKAYICSKVRAAVSILITKEQKA